MHKSVCISTVCYALNEPGSLNQNQGPLRERTRKIVRLKSARYLRTLRLLRLFRPLLGSKALRTHSFLKASGPIDHAI